MLILLCSNERLQLRAVEIANTSHIGTSTININLRNLNDELPIFDENTQAEVSVPEDVDIEHFIATIHATDRDVDDNVTLVHYINNIKKIISNHYF